MGTIRGTHSSPGHYTKFTDLSYAANTLGITKLGLVGETIQGPAFEPMAITSWTQYQTYFGGKSAEKFKDTLYPKYELPYIAESFLKKSDKLYVCRVLGLSGYNAGPLWAITTDSDTPQDGKKHIIAILRSRAKYSKYSGDACGSLQYDKAEFLCKTITLSDYTTYSASAKCVDGETKTSEETNTDNSFIATSSDFGRFTITCTNGNGDTKTYAVSLNAGSKDYIYNVLGSDPSNGESWIYVEDLYDLELQKLINNATNNKIKIDRTITKQSETNLAEICDPVADFITTPTAELKKSMLGRTYLFSGLTYLDSSKDYYDKDKASLTIGYIYKVVKNNDSLTYSKIESGDDTLSLTEATTEDDGSTTSKCVKVLSTGYYYVLRHDDDNNNIVSPSQDYSDYRESFRCASTPWIVSEIKGDKSNLEVKKLFRFHTITDGNYANTQVKISILNIKPDDGTFDIYVRDYNDSDASVQILESYKNLSMIPGTSNYIGYKIGTLDGTYSQKSKYIMVETIESDMTETCVPCGFLGYPVRKFSDIESPTLMYNTEYDEDTKDKRQYFGLSDITGIDSDIFTYKGKSAYTNNMTSGYTKGFHLDSTLVSNTSVTVSVDGVSGLKWDAVSPNNVTENNGGSPIISTENDMLDTIYENINLRKFTVYFYGGFDGWDVNRNSRSNTNDFKANKYKGNLTGVIGSGTTAKASTAIFTKVTDTTSLNLSGNCITSDYYAYLAGANQFQDYEKYPINLFATPGIDYVNNELLVNEIIDMIEEKNTNALYVVTTPDKPSGASDSVSDMYTSSDAASNLEDTSIDTYFAATYYPWVKYYDEDNNTYINLPVTKDVLRNMADVDNKKYPWFAPAGTERGEVECEKVHMFTKLEDEDNVYDARINPVKTFSKDGVKIWGNKTMYTGDTPMNRVNVVRLMLYMRRLIIEATRYLIFDPNDTTLAADFKKDIEAILKDIKSNRGITDYKLEVSQTEEQMDAHEISGAIHVKPTPTLEYIELNFIATPQGVSFS